MIFLFRENIVPPHTFHFYANDCFSSLKPFTKPYQHYYKNDIKKALHRLGGEQGLQLTF
jgi:hypothetical protein